MEAKNLNYENNDSSHPRTATTLGSGKTEHS